MQNMLYINTNTTNDVGDKSCLLNVLAAILSIQAAGRIEARAHAFGKK